MRFFRSGSTVLLLLFGAVVPLYAHQDQQNEKREKQEGRQGRGGPPPAREQRPEGQPQREQQPRVQDNQQQRQQQQQQQKVQDNQQQRQQQQRVQDNQQQQQQQQRVQDNQQQRQQQQRVQDNQQQRQQQQRSQQARQRQQPQRSQQQAAAWQQQRGWLRQGGGWQGQSTWQQGRARQWESEHRNWTQRGGYGGYYIPQDRFMLSFGNQHYFRLYNRPSMYMGYPRFQYGGFSFLLLDPWPEYWAENWYASDDVYVDYDDGYYLYNRRYPNVRLAITVAM